MISYTPNLEDVLLERCFQGKPDGFYIDIGAHHPSHASVTRWFYDRGWSGVNVEPGDGIAEFYRNRTRDTNLRLAVSDFIGQSTFYVHTGNTGTSTLSADPAESVAQKAGEVVALSVEVTTLQNIVDLHVGNRNVDFLKLDAEGEEDKIIRSTNWTTFRPEIIVVESTEPYTNTRRQEEWQNVLISNAYTLAYFDGVNDFWLRDESAQLRGCFKIPINVLDYYKLYDPEVEDLRVQLEETTRALEKMSVRHKEALERRRGVRGVLSSIFRL